MISLNFMLIHKHDERKEQRKNNSQTHFIHHLGKNIVFGAIGGFIAGLVLIPFAMLTALTLGMPVNTIPTAIGLIFGTSKDNAFMMGVAMHLLTSILIGIIFGAAISINKLRISKFTKGISEGLVTGMIAFVIIFIPISLIMMPPVLVQMVKQMNPSMDMQQIMNKLHQNMPIMIGMGIARHLIYGTILGIVTSVLVLKYNKK